jgi:hypothetical protein
MTRHLVPMLSSSVIGNWAPLDLDGYDEDPIALASVYILMRREFGDEEKKRGQKSSRIKDR